MSDEHNDELLDGMTDDQIRQLKDRVAAQEKKRNAESPAEFEERVKGWDDKQFGEYLKGVR